MQKWLGRLLGAVCVMLLLAIPVQAGTAGVIRVWLDPGELPAINGEVTLYYVGYPTAEGYQVMENYGGGFVRECDALSPHLAQWLVQESGNNGVSKELNPDGQAVFSGLPNGLYLLVQSKSIDGFYPISPRMITIPYQGLWEVDVMPALQPIILSEPPKTGDPIEMYVAALLLSGMGLRIIPGFRKRF